MASKVAPLFWYCKTPAGWRHLPAAVSSNGKIRPRCAQVGKQQVEYPDGHYEVRINEGGKRAWRNLGDDARTALAEQQQLARKLTTKTAAAASGDQVVEPPDRIDLRKKAALFIARQITREKNRHAVRAKREINQFLDITKVKYADQITEQVVLDWYENLRKPDNRKTGNSDRTVLNKHNMLFGFLKWCGVATKHMAPDGPPGCTEKKPKIYQPEELGRLLGSLKKQYHKVAYNTLLKTGLREQEAMYLERDNFDFRNGTLTVLTRDDNGFLIKDRAERTLPIPADLVDLLKSWLATQKGRYVLGTGKDKPNGELLPTLKRLARRAGLNCGRCKTCLKNRLHPNKQQCEHWLLKTFRSTYTTNLFRAGIDAKTVMEYTGHEDMKTVLKYLVAAEAKDTRSKINAIAWTC